MTTVVGTAEAVPTAFLGSVVRGRFLVGARAVLQFIDRNIGSRRITRTGALLLVYALNLALAFYLAYQLRWDFACPDEMKQQCATLIIAVVICKLVLLHSFGQFRSVLSYFGLADFAGVVCAISAVSGLMMTLWFGAVATAAPPRGVILMDLVLSLVFISGFRLSLRVVRSWSLSPQVLAGAIEKRIAIVGAGDVGEALAKDLLTRKDSGLRPVFFIDEDPVKIGRYVHGIPVHGPLEKLVELGAVARVNEIVIAMNAAPPRVVKALVDIGRKLGAETRIVPSLTQLATGQVKVDQSRPVAIEDLLGREPVNLNSAGIAGMLRDKVVMITGAGGSIGSELCRQILKHEPSRLVMVDQSEIVLFEIEQELVGTGFGGRMVPLIIDVTDEHALRSVFSLQRPEIVFHAAAHKHVPLMERQPAEAIKNNTLATAGLTRLASEFGVSRFVFISTDKAVNPTSAMGCSKRLAEKALQAQQRAPGNATTFMAVRFGNVLGSSGSVIPTFKRQIAQGGPVTVTHPEMTRYFMTIPEAVGLVLQAATLGHGGEIFILDMSQPVKIIDMARQMIELSGYRPDVDVEIKITGLRPGEKLYEELRHTEETHAMTEHSRIYKLKNDLVDPAADIWLGNLREIAQGADSKAVKQAMKALVPEYTPFAD